MPLTQVDQGLLSSTAQYTGFKNRIINGQMQLDQRNAGASYAQVNAAYNLDRWIGYSYAGGAVTGKYTAQQNAGSVTPPAGFTSYLGVTSSAATADASTNIYGIAQRIEGLNVSDLGWGTANAKTVTLSFWVRSSLTGTFGGSIQNNAQDRSFPFSYTISAANTWEQKSVIIAGDQSGTWLRTSSVGVLVNFGIGVGSTFSGTANAWAAANYYSATSATSVVGTNGATWYLTGVQFEVGSTATSFDFRSISTELALCQRYYEKSFDIGTAPAAGVSSQGSNYDMGTIAYSASSARGPVQGFKVSKRTTPTMILYAPAGYGGTSGNNPVIYIGGGWYNWTGYSAVAFGYGFWLDGSTPATVTNGNAYLMSGAWSANAEL